MVWRIFSLEAGRVLSRELKLYGDEEMETRLSCMQIKKLHLKSFDYPRVETQSFVLAQFV